MSAATVQADVATIAAFAAACRERGPWRVVHTQHPHYLGGVHNEYCIATAWDHPQMKGPLPVVVRSVGIGKREGDKAITMVSMSKEVADLLGACDPDRIGRVASRVTELESQRKVFADCVSLFLELDKTIECSPHDEAERWNAITASARETLAAMEREASPFEGGASHVI